MITRLTSYSELEKWSTAFIEGSWGLFMLVGAPGVGKSYSMRNLVNKMAEKNRIDRAKQALRKTNITPKYDPDYQARPIDHITSPVWFKGGNTSSFKVYQEAYMHLDEVIIFDDVEAVFAKLDLVRLLMALCEMEKVKEIGWHTDSSKLDKAGIPSRFKTRSRVCIIANDWDVINSNKNTRPLMSRGMKIEFCPSVDEVIKQVKRYKIITDTEVMSFVESNKWLMSNIDIRDLENAVIAKKAKLKWKDSLAESMGILDMMIYERIQSNPSYNAYDTGEMKAMDFMRITGKSRPMYFKAQNAYKEAKARRDGRVRVIGAMA